MGLMQDVQECMCEHCDLYKKGDNGDPAGRVCNGKPVKILRCIETLMIEHVKYATAIGVISNHPDLKELFDDCLKQDVEAVEAAASEKLPKPGAPAGEELPKTGGAQ